jgi:hypothetical protein
MKQIIIILALYLFMAGLYAQKWEHTIGLPNIDEESRRVIEHYDNGYLITGYLSTGYGDHHGMVIKTDINGNVLWDKVIGVNPDEVIIQNTVYDEQGNLYIFGLSVGNLDDSFPVIVKLNACGEQQWCRLFYFAEYDYGSFGDAIVLDNGDLLGLANLDNESQHDMIFLFCISPDGEYKWKKSYASCDNYPNFEMRLGSRIQFFDDIYIITGYVYSPHPNFPNTSSIRPIFIGIDSDFNELWVKEFALVDNIKGKAYDCISLNDSVFMGVGTHRFVGSDELINNTILMFFDEKGNEYGYNIIANEDIGPDINSNFIYDIERVNDSLFIGTAAYGEDYEGNPWGEFIIDTSGRVINHVTREQTHGSSHIYKTYDNKYIVATSLYYPNLTWDIEIHKINENLEYDTIYPGNYTYDSLCPYPIESGAIDLTGCGIVTSIDEIPTLEQYRENLQSIGITATPNPTSSGEVLLELENTASFTNMELHVTDVCGKNIHTESILPQQGAVRLQTSQWPAGMYVATVLSNCEVRGKAKFVVR